MNTLYCISSSHSPPAIKGHINVLSTFFSVGSLSRLPLLGLLILCCKMPFWNTRHRLGNMHYPPGSSCIYFNKCNLLCGLEFVWLKYEINLCRQQTQTVYSKWQCWENILLENSFISCVSYKWICFFYKGSLPVLAHQYCEIWFRNIWAKQGDCNCCHLRSYALM